MNETIEKLQGEYIKISKASITIVNKDTNKTKGLIRNIQTFHTLSNQDKQKYFKTVWKFINNHSDNASKTFYIDNEWYFLISQNTLKYLDSFPQHEKDRFLQNIEMAKDNGLKVIEVYFMN